MSTREQKIGYIAWVTICVVWGTTYLANRVALESLPVALLAGFRWTAAGLLLMAALPIAGMRLPPRRTWRSIAIVGFLMNVMGNGILTWAQQYVPSGLAAVVVAMVPFWSVAVESLLPKGERITRRTLLGLAAGMAGILVLMWPALMVGGRAGRMFVIGILALQVGSIAWAIGTSYTKRHSLGATPLASAALQMVFSGIVLLTVGTVVGDWSRLRVTPRGAAALAYLAVFGSAIGYTAYVYAVKYLRLSTVSLYAYVNPIIAVMLGTLLLAEPFSARIVVAAGLVFLGIAIVRSQGSPRSTVDGPQQSAVASSQSTVASSGSKAVA